MVFLSGRGGGQWGVPVQSTPAIGLGSAGGGTAGRAQLGIVFFDWGGVGGGALSAVVDFRWWSSRGGVPRGTLEQSIGWVRGPVEVGRAGGFGAGGGSFGWTCCRVRSGWGGGHGCWFGTPVVSA